MIARREPSKRDRGRDARRDGGRCRLRRAPHHRRGAPDPALFEAGNTDAGPGADRFFLGVTELGSLYAAGAAAGVLAVSDVRARAFARSRRPGLPGCSARAEEGGGPAASLRGRRGGTRFLIAPPHGTSWPSSHPAVFTTFTTVAARELGIGGLGSAGLTSVSASVAASRVYVGVHYPSDVASGFLWVAPSPRCGHVHGERRAPSGSGPILAPPIDSASVLPSTLAIGWPVLDRIRFGDAFAISPHGLFIAIGFLVGAWLLGRIAPRWGVSGRDRQRGRVLVADRRDHRLATVLRDRPLLRVRQRRPDARDLARRHLAARRHRRRGHHQRVPRAARGLPLLPGRRPGGSRTGPGHRGGADRRPHHRRPPRQAHELVPGLALRGRHARATVRVRQRVVPGGAPGRPPADDRPRQERGCSTRRAR